MKRIILIFATAVFTLTSYSCRQAPEGGQNNPSQSVDRRSQEVSQDPSEVDDPMQEVREESGDPGSEN